MELMTLAFGLFVLTAAMLLGQIFVVAHWYRTVRESGKSHEANVKRLVTDLGEAMTSVLVISEKCDCEDDDEQRIETAIRDAEKRSKDLKIEFVWGGHRGELPAFLRRLGSEEKLIEIHLARGRLPFTGRIIDGRVVEIHRGPDGNLIPKGEFVRARRAAPGMAESLADLAYAA